MQIALLDLAETARLGAAMARAALSNEDLDEALIIALSGPLGAGKTALTKAVGAALGVKEIISSPTFTMLNEYYSGALPLFHMDLYRAGNTGEVMDLTMLAVELEESMDSPMILILEWAEFFDVSGQNFLAGRDHLKIDLEIVKQTNDPRIAKYFCNGSQKDQGGQLLREATEIGKNFESPQKLSIKDGIADHRIATLRPLGANAEALVATLTAELSDILINC
ncbi:MAG: tRNA threonylcarbamoyladenosine biosynthesis protein TsaE [Cyanobacteriota bacterium erpe_2018_sw_39hr_WHONDRS-SW48-000098_B_bin.30]|jgi:tRNA threonylcarbamoyladenosine biosynthesis protein TsaE|nr:tRNA threonylcarbamoyladenosine biosynthesis protein TsaE [Cyanobacteriota bacterium erpe_2018_sw_39hr_WHONDRS-SW48-000098_B_bin.30]